MARRILSVTAATVVGLGALAGCSGGGQEGPRPGKPEGTSSGSAPPSATRHVPPKERVRLATLSPDALCGLVPADVMERLAFPVRPGTPREVSFDPPVRGCLFEAAEPNRSVLVSAQPDGFEDLGWDEVELGGVAASKTQHTNDCTVYAGVERATLQITVTSAEAEAQQCQAAEDIARYAVPALVR